MDRYHRRSPLPPQPPHRRLRRKEFIDKFGPCLAAAGVARGSREWKTCSPAHCLAVLTIVLSPAAPAPQAVVSSSLERIRRYIHQDMCSKFDNCIKREIVENCISPEFVFNI
jgi:hypothetical protein